MGFLPQPISITALLFGRKRSIGEIQAYVTERESATDKLTITRQPVQQGANISDHAFKEPAVLNMTIKMQPTGLGAFLGQDGLEELYSQFLELQTAREPITVQTPKRTYQNMLVASITCDTDKFTENILALQLVFEEVLIVTIGIVTVDRVAQGLPGTTMKTKKVGRKSVLNTLFGGNLSSITSQLGGGG